MDQISDGQLLLSYAVTQFASGIEAAYSGGNTDVAIYLQDLRDEAAKRLAEVCDIIAPDAEDIDLVVEQARKTVTEHVPELSVLLGRLGL